MSHGTVGWPPLGKPVDGSMSETAGSPGKEMNVKARCGGRNGQRHAFAGDERTAFSDPAHGIVQIG